MNDNATESAGFEQDGPDPAAERLASVLGIAPARTPLDMTRTAAAVLADVGAAIREAREQAGLTQVQAGEAIGVTQAAWSRWETGKFGPRIAELLHIASALRVPAAALLPRPRTMEEARAAAGVALAHLAGFSPEPGDLVPLDEPVAGTPEADLLEEAWGVIANAGWDDCAKSPHWQEAAVRWRDRYFELLPPSRGTAALLSLADALGDAPDGPEQYHLRPSAFSAWRVSRESARAIAQWVHGSCEDGETIRVHVPTEAGPLTAAEGWWVVRYGTSSAGAGRHWVVPPELFASAYISADGTYEAESEAAGRA